MKIFHRFIEETYAQEKAFDLYPRGVHEAIKMISQGDAFVNSDDEGYSAQGGRVGGGKDDEGLAPLVLQGHRGAGPYEEGEREVFQMGTSFDTGVYDLRHACRCKIRRVF